MPKKVPPLLMQISQASNVGATTIYDISKELSQLDDLILQDAIIIVNQNTIEKLVKEIQND